MLSLFFFSGRCDNFGYGFMTLSQNVFYQSDRATGWRYAAKQVRMPSVLGLAGLIFLAKVSCLMPHASCIFAATAISLIFSPCVISIVMEIMLKELTQC